jgi:hypothetical protein
LSAWFHKKGGGLFPSDDKAKRGLDRLGDGECVLLTIVRPRSVAWHRMYFAVCRQIGMNQEPQRDESSIDRELRIRAGHYDVLFIEGHEVRVPKRIAFDKLSAEKWSELWPSLEKAIAETFGDEYLRETSL